MSEMAPCAFMASILFAAVLACELGSSLKCSADMAQRLAGLLPELMLLSACNDADTWCEAITRGEFLLVDTTGMCQLQWELQGQADTTTTYLYHNVLLHLVSVFEDAMTPRPPALACGSALCCLT